MSEAVKKIVLGIDIGTTGTKCTFYDLGGFPVAGAYREYAMIHPREGWVEEDPSDWWRAVVDNVKSVIASGDVEARAVAAVGVSCTNSFIPVDREGRHLHNAILQLDQRAAGEVEWIEEHIGAERVYAVTGNRIARGTFSLPTLRWYLNNRPDIMERTYKFLVPSGFIICKLTGEFSINTSRMGFTLLSDIRSGTWDEALARDAAIPVEMLPRPYRAHEIVGGVTKAAAALTGLIEGTPVVAGAMDTVAAAVGAGAVEAGDAFLAMGTCGRLCHTTDRPLFDDRLMNCRHAIEGQWLNVEATNGAGVSLRWFRDLFGGVLEERARRSGRSLYEAIDDEAGKSLPGAGGLIYLPYLSGERCPIWDPDARGVFFGLHLGSSYGDMVRAIMEGVAFSIRQGMEIVLGAGSRSSNYLSLGGGIANSPVWSQVFADVLERPIVRLKVNETETLGDAILAAYGVGLIDSPREMARSAAEGGAVLSPRKEYVACYRDSFALYCRLYEDLKGDFKVLQRLKEQRGGAR
ncbi:carbohydrate kinase [Aminithiophilus ramosus]|uniref:Carbohydrate kinase n=2 Tax=Synergistales TaxID=649776 RepID=A0A9Q7A532_9BACT|nr:FGGY family carbohydrate kinase [Aminithiophilus ramosus]QTX31396.1 carbohydrate kinase [Aminithiophilus ramosus]QVL35195.1 carbohydrate kinase [Synergistota bacterium]